MLHVVVRGRVQGVGFRWFVRSRARELGLTGWVRNGDDGGVEVAASGDAAALDRLRDAMREGPPAAHVTGLEDVTTPLEQPLTDSFIIIR